MPLFLLLAGALFLTSGIRNTQGELFSLIGEEFVGKDGKPGFGATAVAVGGTAALGYSPTLRPLSNAMLALVFLALIAANVRANNNPFRRISAFVTNPGGSTQ